MRMLQNCLRDSSSQNLSGVHGSSSAMLALAIPVRTDAARRAAVIVFMIISFLRLEPQLWALEHRAGGARSDAGDIAPQ
jgi:hypothetical protein